ncbi:MAG: hypothetical protein OEW18_07385 [Candidatus Aminicenantes bacterium]|nr:hypothetical protein [Candidatus Aminicenantes bacterium]
MRKHQGVLHVPGLLGRIFLALIICVCVFSSDFAKTGRHVTQDKVVRAGETEWQIEASLKYDVLCLLNILTADPFYLKYYQPVYEEFKNKLTEPAKNALADLKTKIKDERSGIISAFLCLYFSATDDVTLEDMLQTVQRSEIMRTNLKETPYYSEEAWQFYESIRPDLFTVLSFLKDQSFGSYWKNPIYPRIEARIREIEEQFAKFDVVAEVEAIIGKTLSSHKITAYLLAYSKPHGLKVTGTRYLTSVDYPFEITLRNAIHEMMHPPYDLTTDEELRAALEHLKEDEFLMDKVLNHNPAFGYNSFEGFVEVDCVQALEQIINEKLGIAVKAQVRWENADEGMHVLAVALHHLIKKKELRPK